MNHQQSKAILVVDDSESDNLLLMRAVKALALPNPVHCVDTVTRGIAYFKGEGEFSDREKCPMPFLALVDMKLPGQGGLELLRWVRSQPDLWGVILIGMTSSENPELMRQAYQLGANSFLIKPVGPEIPDTLKHLHHYWTVINRT